jgi:1,4-dihydroxy-2-naphthoate octaprenyltransferase
MRGARQMGMASPRHPKAESVRPQTALVGIVGILVGIALALCFLRIANLAFHLIAFLFWIGVGVVITAAVYSFLRFRWRER